MPNDPMTARPAPLTMTQHQWDLYAYARRESTQAAPEGALSFDAVALFDECCATRALVATLREERDAAQSALYKAGVEVRGLASDFAGLRESVNALLATRDKLAAVTMERDAAAKLSEAVTTGGEDYDLLPPTGEDYMLVRREDHEAALEGLREQAREQKITIDHMTGLADKFRVKWAEAKLRLDQTRLELARVTGVRDALRCETTSGKHEWRMGQWAGADERPVWCCKCARDATTIVDAALAALSPAQPTPTEGNEP